jgi:hypothetical protein
MNKREPVLKMQKTFLKMYFKYNKKAYHNFVTGDETWVYNFEPKRKCSNLDHQECITMRQRTVKKVLYVIFFDNKGPVMQIPYQKAER